MTERIQKLLAAAGLCSRPDGGRVDRRRTRDRQRDGGAV